MRRLTAHERSLWARVAASVKPLPGRTLPEAPPVAVPVPTPVATAPLKPGSPRPSPKPVAKPATAKAAHPMGATLDGSWDRRITRGRLTPDRVLDLHGHTVAEAHGLLYAAATAGDGARVLLVITGKGRPDRPSRIRAELMHWLERPDMRSAVASVRAAHPRHGGGGAFYVILRRPK